MNNLRILSGTLRGRSIKSPNSTLTHPMGSREKLALFNLITDYLPGARVLDAFAGSGALGIEAISRGAREVVFVEKNRPTAEVIKQNLANLNLEAQVFTQSIANFTDGTGFDVILTDPPYDDFKVELIEKLAEMVKTGGVLVLSHPKDAPKLPNLELIKTRQYAAAHVSVYAK